MTITTDFLNKVKTELESLNQIFPLKMYWDHNYTLSNKDINKIIKGDVFEVEDEIYNNNLDHIHDLENERLKEAFENVNTDDTLDYEDVRDELRDELLAYLSVDINLKKLIRNSGHVNVRLELLSDYDCINSHHFEIHGGGGYEYQDSYFADMIDALNLNPIRVKQMFIKKNVKTKGDWKNIPDRDGKEYISYEDFWQEIENNLCSSTLTFMGTIDLTEYLNKNNEITTVTVPGGNLCGLYSSFQGGGSVLGMELKRDFTVVLDIKNYFGYRIELDKNIFNYSIHETYGMSQSAWGKSIKIE